MTAELEQKITHNPVTALPTMINPRKVSDTNKIYVSTSINNNTIHAYRETHVHPMHVHTHIQTNTHTHRYAHTCTYTHTHAHARAHTQTHTHNLLDTPSRYT